ncbi:inositol polyphosphate 1-phosphatase isoform X2 [Oratosquilla oratoria]|uniref:inositol polyphosphate 1-phosphatase isoform X2 n=1 Tax=Oratosquilla oratoria TaxID=337810 RepID=UPI003F774ABB
MAQLIQTLLSFSEQAGEIARAIRCEPQLFSLLVEEKGEGEKNQRFDHDFKTLADVLIQESLRHCVTQQFPNLGQNVHGEESAQFTNTLGETITVQVCETKELTAQLLAKVLNGNTQAAALLASVVHSCISLPLEEELATQIPSLPTDDLGIWIDPIDSTGEYVRGDSSKECHGIITSGLPCVTVLIGLYHRSTGQAIAGVVNQPFHHCCPKTKRWQGKAYWGISYEGLQIHNIPDLPSTPKGIHPTVVLSSSEAPHLQQALKERFTLIPTTGAGYKILLVVLGTADAYFLSKGSTFRWDTCAPHGVLRALGGNVLRFQLISDKTPEEAIEQEELLCIRYHKPNESQEVSNHWCNLEGVVAYRQPRILHELLHCLHMEKK